MSRPLLVAATLAILAATASAAPAADAPYCPAGSHPACVAAAPPIRTVRPRHRVARPLPRVARVEARVAPRDPDLYEDPHRVIVTDRRCVDDGDGVTCRYHRHFE